MADYPDLRSGLFTATFTWQESQKLWQMLTNLLNNVAGGAKKDWVKCRKVLLNKILFFFKNQM